MFVRVWILEITRESKQSPCKRVVSNGNLRVDVTLFPKRRYHVPRSKGKREMQTETKTKTKTKREVESLTISANYRVRWFFQALLRIARREGDRPGSPMTR